MALDFDVLAASRCQNCFYNLIIVAMAHNDSDSSDDDGSFTTTNVMLGYASREPTDDNFSQLGGYPVRASPFLAHSLLAET